MALNNGGVPSVKKVQKMHSLSNSNHFPIRVMRSIQLFAQWIDNIRKIVTQWICTIIEVTIQNYWSQFEIIERGFSSWISISTTSTPFLYILFSPFWLFSLLSLPFSPAVSPTPLLFIRFLWSPLSSSISLHFASALLVSFYLLSHSPSLSRLSAAILSRYLSFIPLTHRPINLGSLWSWIYRLHTRTHTYVRHTKNREAWKKKYTIKPME